jgi:hypothetical protein
MNINVKYANESFMVKEGFICITGNEIHSDKATTLGLKDDIRVLCYRANDETTPRKGLRHLPSVRGT